MHNLSVQCKLGFWGCARQNTITTSAQKWIEVMLLLWNNSIFT